MGIIQKLRKLLFRQVSEQRKYPRVPLSVKVTKLDSGAFQYYQASNISAGGMFIKADEPLPIGTRLRITVSMPRHPLEVEGEVVRVMLEGGFQSGMGVKFDALPEDQRQMIEAFVAQEM